MITRQDVAARLTDHLHHRLSLEDLVNWAENAMVEGEFGLPGKILRNSCLVWVTMCVLG